VTHSQLAADLLEVRISADPAVKPAVLDHARNFRHIGSYVLPTVSNAKENNFGAILEMDRRIEELTGNRLAAVPATMMEDAR
jgi:hypothetical protein